MRRYALFAIFLGLLQIAMAGEQFKVVWVAEYSSKNLKASEASFGEKLMNFFFGAKKMKIQRPFSLFLDGAGRCVFLDQGSGRIGRIDLGQKRVDWLKQKDGIFLYSAVGICPVDDNGFLISDAGLNKIFYYNVKEDKLTVWNEKLAIDHPTGIAYYPEKKQVVVVETGKHRLVFLDQNGKIVRTLGKRGTGPLEFNYPTFIWIDKFGTIYVNDSMNFRIQIIGFNGEVKNIFGKAGDVSGYMARPKGIATDSRGHIYVVDALFNAVQVFDQQGQLLTFFGGQGRAPGEFWIPVGIFIDDNDRIFIADSFNSRVQEFKLKKQGKP